MESWHSVTEQWQALLPRLGVLTDSVAAAATALAETLRSGGKILACGNGGSASQASHLCAELVGRFSKPRRPLPAICLSSDASVLTCIVNDYDPADLFARQVEGLGQPSDCLVAISTSGASENVGQGLHSARDKGLRTIALLGESGHDRPKPAFGVADHEIIVPSDVTARVQEVHIMIIHAWCEHIDEVCAD